jgi:O-antigen ligase
MTVEVTPEEGPEAGPGAESEEGAPDKRGFELKVAAAAMAVLPGALILYLSFNGGGFFPGPVGFTTLVVIQLLLLRVLLARDPFAGVSGPVVAVAGVLAAFAGWVLASGFWSPDADRPLIEFDRALLYVLLFVLFGTLPRTRWRPGWLVRGTAIGAFLVCGAGLITRVLPHVWHISPGVANQRLSYPITYWNALGLLAAIGALMAIGLTSSDQESRAGRVLAAASIPVFATTLLFTFSRGGILAFACGFVAYVIVSRQRHLVGGLVAVLPPAVVALIVAFGADKLATDTPTTAAAVEQGKPVAAVVVGCMIAAALLRLLVAPLDRRVASVHVGRAARRRVRIAILATVGVIVIGGVASGWVGDQYDKFSKGGSITDTGDLRGRLTDPSSNGRAPQWQVALDTFADKPLRGNGTGTYQWLWDRHRDVTYTVADAHGLYFETLAELGIVGLLLVVAPIVAILVAFVLRARGPNRGFYAALFGAGVAWAIHAGVDWDWEMPAVTAWLFAAGGGALASRGRRRAEGATVASGNRIVIAAGLVVLAVTPLLMMLSQSHLASAARAFNRGDCQAAKDQAYAALANLSVRPQPYQVLGYCDLDEGRPRAAMAAMTKASEQNPESWEYRFGLGLARAEAGLDPRATIRAALERNPREPLVQRASKDFGQASNPSEWRRAAEDLRVAAETSGRLTLR